MLLRETTTDDIAFAADHSASRGCFDKIPERYDYSYTLEHEGQVLGMGGIILINPTTAWAWVDIMDIGIKKFRSGYRILREWLDELRALHQIQRLQVYVETDFPEAIRMAEHLGFERESTMKNFVGDKDAYMYVRLTKPVPIQSQVSQAAP